MSASSRETPLPGNRDKAKVPLGWKAFDLKQRQKQQGLVSEIDSEAYPVLSGSNAPMSLLSKNETLFQKPFSSAVVASTNFPSLLDTKARILQRQLPLNDSSLKVENGDGDSGIRAHQKLKFFHPWADESLIEDVMAGVNYNLDEALSLLEAMLISEKDEINIEKVQSTVNDQEIESLGTQCTPSMSNDPSNGRYKESKDEGFSLLPLGASKALRIEPDMEWEEDDLYLIHRKDAIKMIRAASRHSKAANDAYLRGNHVEAHLFSLKAQEEWFAAEKLNVEAAKEILMVRNSKNDPWTLDLHGLHAGEAVDALHERLQTVESLVVPSDGVPKGLGVAIRLKTRAKIEEVGSHDLSTKQKQRILQVITGKGNHSRGAAALPSAIKNFLIEHGYHFDENRPGTFMVRPKFRHR